MSKLIIAVNVASQDGCRYTQTVYTGPYGGDHSEKEEPKEEPMATGHGVATVKDEVKEEGSASRASDGVTRIA